MRQIAPVAPSTHERIIEAERRPATVLHHLLQRLLPESTPPEASGQGAILRHVRDRLRHCATGRAALLGRVPAGEIPDADKSAVMHRSAVMNEINALPEADDATDTT